MRPSRILLGIITLAVALRLAVALVEPMSTRSDAGAYLAMAASAARGDGLVDSFGGRAYYSAGYPMLLAAVFLATGPRLGAVLTVNLALAAASVFLVHRLARCAAGGREPGDCPDFRSTKGDLSHRPPAAGRENGTVPLASSGEDNPRRSHVNGCKPPREAASKSTPTSTSSPFSAASERAGLLAAFAWAVYVPGIVLANGINKENLMIPLMLGLAWTAVGWRTSARRVRRAAVAGALTGMLGVVGTTACAVAGAVAAVVAVYGNGWRQRLAAGAAFLLAAAVFLAPWMYRNYVVVGVPVIKTNPGFNFYMGNNPAATGRFVSIGDTPLAGEWNRIRAEEGEAAADREAARQAWQHIRENPGRTLALFAKKAVLFWEPPYLGGEGPEPLAKRALRYIWFAQYLALIGLAVAGLRDIRRTWPLYLAIALFAAIHVPFVVMLRYRLPVMALISCALGFRFQVSGVRR